MKLAITLTGADERTPLCDLLHLATWGAEIGLLYTYSPDGRNRYPSAPWIAKTAGAMQGRAAIHICGERARQQLYDGELDPIVSHVKRIQVNGVLEPAWLVRVCERYPRHTIITQHCPKNLWLLPVEAENHAVLVDSSGGRGQLPAEWVQPATDKPFGFAGGLGPSNLREELPFITSVARTDSWIDMEGKLRDDNDNFSMERAGAVMEIWSKAA